MTAEVRRISRAGAPTPLLPANAVLRGEREIPVLLADILETDWANSLDLFEHGAVLILHARSMDGTPSGSLPDDDVVLARYLGLGRHDVDRFAQMRPKVLNGWITCSDGRLYHPGRAKAVLRVWLRRLLLGLYSALGNEAKGFRLVRTVADVEADIEAGLRALRAIDPADPLVRSITTKMTRRKGEPPALKQPRVSDVGGNGAGT